MGKKKWVLDLKKIQAHPDTQAALKQAYDRVREDGAKAYDQLLKNRGQ